MNVTNQTAHDVLHVAVDVRRTLETNLPLAHVFQIESLGIPPGRAL